MAYDKKFNNYDNVSCKRFRIKSGVSHARPLGHIYPHLGLHYLQSVAHNLLVVDLSHVETKNGKGELKKDTLSKQIIRLPRLNQQLLKLIIALSGHRL